MNKSTIKYILIAITIGVIIGKYIFDLSKEEIKSVINTNEEYIYIIQYGVYSDLDNLNNSVSNLKNYIYVKEDDGLHVYVAISKNKKILEKIGGFLELMDNIYIKRVKINNIEFLNSLDQYDKLINQTSDKDVIINAEKQVLSKYEELILNNE